MRGWSHDSSETAGTYPHELRERAVRLVLEHQGEHESQWEVIGLVVHTLGPTPEAVRMWVRRAEVDGVLDRGDLTGHLFEVWRDPL